jgi:2-polyprenyl-6-methoxyphenol hydroxylase-like FAD-dependent oxidoreductase
MPPPELDAMPPASQSTVIVLGAGPVGLGAALELARFGVRSILVEKHERVSWHPKTRNLNTRTMEIARAWGPLVYKRLRSIDTPPGWKSPIRFLETAVGKQFGVIESKGFEGPGPEISPAEPVMSSQELIESILLDAVRATGLVDVRFRTEATRLVRGGAPGDDGVELAVTCRRTGESETLSGAALVAADGASSLIRSELGLRLVGDQGMAHIVNCYFRADIERHIGDRHGVLLFTSSAEGRGVLQPLDAAGRWLCQISVTAEEWSENVFTKKRAIEWIRAAVGVDDLEPDVLSIGFWKLNSTVVERMVLGRVVLCGDAAHQFPPTGGLGVNTGLQGVHNAIWKLALYVKGHANWSLVETYHAERHPVATRITSQSKQNSINVARIQAAAIAGLQSGFSAEDIVRESRRYGNHLGAEFGACYVSAAVMPDGTAPPAVEDDYSDYVPSATPGCRAPHVLLGDPDQSLSTLDLFGTGFTLLAATRAEGWSERLAALPADLAPVVVGHRIGVSPGLQDRGGFAAAYGLKDDGAVLVRPDGHVAWRSASAPGNGANQLERVLRRILGDDA